MSKRLTREQIERWRFDLKNRYACFDASTSGNQCEQLDALCDMALAQAEQTKAVPQDDFLKDAESPEMAAWRHEREGTAPVPSEWKNVVPQEPLAKSTDADAPVNASDTAGEKGITPAGTAPVTSEGLVDKDIVEAIRDSEPTEREWKALTHNSGPYDITTPNLFTKRFAERIAALALRRGAEDAGWIPVDDQHIAIIETATADPHLTFKNALPLPKHATAWRPARRDGGSHE